MSRIRGRDTVPELVLRSMLHRLGYRFTVNAPNNRQLPGRPDIVLPKFNTAIFVHGCFWHGHEDCKDFRIPKTRTEWWRAKIEGNRARDQRNLRFLESMGWNVIVVWACRMRNLDALAELEREVPTWFDLPQKSAIAAETPGTYRTKR